MESNAIRMRFASLLREKAWRMYVEFVDEWHARPHKAYCAFVDRYGETHDILVVFAKRKLDEVNDYSFVLECEDIREMLGYVTPTCDKDINLVDVRAFDVNPELLDFNEESGHGEGVANDGFLEEWHHTCARCPNGMGCETPLCSRYL